MADNEGLRTAGEAIVLSVVPDFCKTPPSMLPVPYQILGRFSDGERYVETVCMTSLNVMTMDSRLNTVYGDEAGTGGGIISTVNEGWCRPITHSSTVRSGGHYITYHTSIYWMNCNGPEGPGNTIGVVVYVECISDVYIGPLGTIEGNTNPPVVAETEEEKGFFDQVGGFFGGVWDGAVDTVTGIKDMGVGAWNITGGWIFDPEQAQKSWDNLKNVAGAVWDNPGVVWDAIKAPYVEAWSKGEYGNAIGRGTFEVLSMVFGGKGLDKLGKTSKVSKLATTADKVSDIGKTVDKIGDIGKTGDKIGDVGKSLNKVDDVTKTLDKVGDTAKTVEATTPDGVKISKASNKAKGIFGEAMADDFMAKKGFEKIGGHGKKPQGIDGVYKNSTPPPPYVIGEAKYGGSGYGKTASGKQMSDEWVDFRLDEAVGKEQADIIRKAGFEKWELRVDQYGNVAKSDIAW